MDDLRTIVPKNLFLSIKSEAIVSGSESREEQSFMCDLGTIAPKNVFLLITWERVFIKIRNKMDLCC